MLKQRELCETQKLENYRQELINRRLMREKFGLNFDNSNQSHRQTNMGPESTTPSADTTPNGFAEIMNVISEHDSLLHVLLQDKRKTAKSSGSTLEAQADSGSTPSVVSSASSDSLYKCGSKLPKDDKTFIEELETVNDKLRQLVFKAYTDMEFLQKENKALKEEIQKLRDDNRNAISSTVPELPPLEPPALLY